MQLESYEQILNRIQIGNIQTAYSALNMPNVFYIGGKGPLGVFIPKDNPDEAVPITNSCLRIPYDILEGFLKPYKDHAAEIMPLYRLWLNEMITSHSFGVREELSNMAKAVMMYGKIMLVCWCRMTSMTAEHQMCHGDEVAERVAGIVVKYLARKYQVPVVIGDEVRCYKCGSKIERCVKDCWFCGIQMYESIPIKEETFELEPEEVTPALKIYGEVDDSPRNAADLEFEITRLRDIVKYYDMLRTAAMEPNEGEFIDIDAYVCAANIWKTRQQVATKLEELKDEYINETRYLIQPPYTP